MRPGLFVAMMTVPSILFSQSYNMEYFGNVNTRAVPGARYSACWGYTAVDGHEYALLGCDSGTAVIDIQATPPVEVDFVYGPKNGWREMKTYLHYAYIVSESTSQSEGGVQILDLSHLPDSVSLVNRYVWTDTLGGTPYFYPAVHSVSVSGHYLYLNGGGGSPNGIRILDISDPVNPIKAGVFSVNYIHDSFVRDDTIYASAIYGQGLQIINATNKANLTIAKSITYANSGTHNAWTTTDRRYVLTTDEIGTTPKTLKIWNIADINNPSYVTQYANIAGATVHNVFIKGNLAYVAWYNAGLRVIDISNPAAPFEAGYYDTYPSNDNAGYNGAWGADPFFPSGKVIISDMITGLHVVRYTGDKRGVVNGTVSDAWSGAPLTDVILHFPDLAISRWTDAAGHFVFGYAPGTFRVRMERPGFGPYETTITVTENETTAVNLAPVTLTSVPSDPSAQPSEYSLSQNYPNPFNPTTTIRYSLAAEEHVTLKVYNILGKELLTLVDGRQGAGGHTVSFTGHSFPSGLYFYRLTAGSFVSVRTMTMLK